MNVQLFKKLAGQLLEIHYGLDLNDTRISEDKVVSDFIQQNLRPYQAVNEHAEKTDLDRSDLNGFYGDPSKASLAAQDEYMALALVNQIQLLCEQPMTCPLCSSRTAFDDLECGKQHHRCLAVACGHEFMAEEDDEGWTVIPCA